MIARPMWNRWIVIVCLGISCAARAAPSTMPTRLDKTKRPIAVHYKVDGTATTPHEIEVPQGWYVVRLRAKAAPPSDRAADVEGARVSVPGAAPVYVSDGRLTIANGDGIATIDVRSAHDPRRVIAWLNIGGSDSDPRFRRVGWDIRKTGWRGYVKRYVEPQLAWGARRITVHNPFGTLPDEDMQFDQYLHARRARLRWLTGGFVEAWRPITAREGVEVICYLGAMSSDPDFNEPAKTDPVAGWQPRFWASVQPALSAEMNVAFDASSGSALDSPTCRAMRLLEERGVKTYIEARPLKSMPHLWKYPVYSTDTFWHQSDPARDAEAARWAARNEDLTNEVIRIITAPPPGKTWAQSGWIAPYIRAILEDGHSAAVPVDMLIRERVALVDLLERDQPSNENTHPSN